MLLDPQSLTTDLERLEQIEKASLRLVVQALLDFREAAAELFLSESDKAQDKAEDATREAIDMLGVSRVPQRLYGKIDYKRARYLFHPEFALKQALFVDSKAEKTGSTIRLQIAQTSMRILHLHSDGVRLIDEQGTLPTVLTAGEHSLLTTTIFAKYEYHDAGDGHHHLRRIKVAALPSGLLQQRYNPSSTVHIWAVGPNAPALGEDFRSRMSFSRLAHRCPWRQQIIPMAPAVFIWEDGPYVPPPATATDAEQEEANFETLEMLE